MNSINRLIARTAAPAALIATTTLLAPACSNDNTSSAGNDAGLDASSGGKTTGAGGASSSGGKATGGTAGSGAAGSSTGGAGVAGHGTVDASDASADAASPDASESDGGKDATADSGVDHALCTGGDAGTPAHVVLVDATSYCTTCTTSQVAAVDLGRGCVLGRTTYPDTDTVPRASSGHGFVVERTLGHVSVLGDDGVETASIDLKPSDGSTAPLNPHDVVYVHPSGKSAKAYVSLYAGGKIAVLDLDTNTVSSEIDLSSFHDASDSDGSSDPDVGFYDATTGRVYFVLQRTDLNTAAAAPYIVHCPTVPSVLIAIDPATDTLVDLNGAAAGVALPLSLVAPSDIAIDAAGRRALILSNGCLESTARAHAGIESVNLDTLADAVLYTAPSTGFLDHIALLSADSAALEAYDPSFALLWNAWKPSTTTLGAALVGVPDQAVAEAADSLVGVLYDGAKARVARYKVSTQVATTIVSEPFRGSFDSTTGIALVR